MIETAFATASGESLLKEAGDGHFLRPMASRLGRLCRAFLTNQRVVLCEAYYDASRRTEKSVGGVLYQIPLSALESIQPGPETAEPGIILNLRGRQGELEKVLLFFRDPGWAGGQSERSEERDAWLESIAEERSKAGSPLPPITHAVSRAPQAAPAAAAPGRVLSEKYELGKQIGSGGMGVVYLGRDQRLERPVAIKRMRPEINSLGRDKALFLREARTSAALHHPFIVDIYDIVDLDDDLFLVFELIDGLTLQEYLDKQGPMPPERVLPMLKCVCEALDFAHTRKVVHRDLKASNIMMTKQGYAKVMDFGISRMMKDTASKLATIDTSGTLPYMAPEQELGRSDVRSDVFALGVTVYELLSGDLPFQGPNFYLQKEKRLFRPLLEIAPRTPDNLAAAVEKCLQFDAAHRFQSVADFAAAAGAA